MYSKKKSKIKNQKSKCQMPNQIQNPNAVFCISYLVFSILYSTIQQFNNLTI